ncbi:galactose-specific lectin nattectin-like [Pempheris klunzingeri]|uniref:galactose-specific lectin nattectin-like n=1 Tax=Pempheris klunzingeri TaxID=3127111 RepID=UPI00397EC046
MAAGLHFIALLCLAGGLWIGANADPSEECCVTCKTCPTGWTQFGDHCYLYHNDEKNWPDAEVACIGLGANLASIPNKAVHEFLKQIILTATNYQRRTWAGGHDTIKEGLWMWTDGSRFDFKLWLTGEPNNGHKREHCLELNYLGGPNDVHCSERKPFICGKRL